MNVFLPGRTAEPARRPARSWEEEADAIIGPRLAGDGGRKRRAESDSDYM